MYSFKDTDIMIFGKHKGKMLGEMPADYMMWLYYSMKEKKGRFAMMMGEYLETNLEYYKQQLGANIKAEYFLVNCKLCGWDGELEQLISKEGKKLCPACGEQIK